MSRATIDYGIDLGTTNSAVAVLQDVEPVVIPNREGRLFTPSAVWIDKRGQVHVGQEAKQRCVSDADNAASEFKLRMGEGENAVKVFGRSGRRMLPEELSAEVLKSLKADVHQSTGQDLSAAVITVPAAFDSPQCDATRKAAELAGIEVSPLLQEPVAAALAYGFQSTSDKVFWLVYDFGGGTFDAAIMQVREGVIQVVEHAGDNFLGGKLIDWDIVEQVFVPRLTEEYDLPEFRRGNHQWAGAMAKLKEAAEDAKIRVSRTGEPFEVWNDNLCEDASGETVELECQMTPEELAAVATPYVTQSLNLCRKALSQARLSPADIEKVLLVGGTSLLPSLREALNQELGIPLEFSIDPITVVARGAAVFAGTQRLRARRASRATSSYVVELEYEPIASEKDPLIGGRVSGPTDDSLDGFTIEFVETRSEWRSGRIPLKDGAFMTNVHAEKGRKCEFQIELCDSTGTRHETEPDRFSYTVGMVMTGGAPLTHNVGVAMANNRLDCFFAKGKSLPCRLRQVHYTTRSVETGAEGELIRLPVVEGESTLRADRNWLIGYLEIEASDPRVKRDLPANSEVEITIAIDESRLLTTKAYIPLLDEEFEQVMTLRREQRPVEQLRKDLEREKARLEEVREKVDVSGDAKAEAPIARIESENIVEQAESHLSAAEGDSDAVSPCDKRILALKAAIDEAEDAVAFPALVQEAKEGLADTRRMVELHGKEEDRTQLADLEKQTERAVESKDVDVLEQQVEEVRSLYFKMAERNPGFWMSLLSYAEQEKEKMRDQAEASALFTQARRAVDANDLESLKAATRQLIGLLPLEEREKAPGYGGTTIRFEQ